MPSSMSVYRICERFGLFDMSLNDCFTLGVLSIIVSGIQVFHPVF